jgi:hypothetical protein
VRFVGDKAQMPRIFVSRPSPYSINFPTVANDPSNLRCMILVGHYVTNLETNSEKDCVSRTLKKELLE